ncbi:isoprenylcysteine carboxyl methyltransferase family protein [Bacillus sp. SJS]|uniref:isoprenylcysteine carboxyl methyltransferase family protein n=1 Tax=Bacillus sp. SJS TaxID=1423321 RepID=UPI0004DCCBA6|nr:isoprenylcysteine carboxylmethyltransferase family protein [Bacillus sp. SJS]KZZ86355.1 isoprenylcysteine carboxyl methyltransferase [Bacillus sp. SJS]
MTVLIILFVIVLQRISELIIARSNEKKLKSQGGIEYGQEHYPYMVCMHAAFLLSLIAEVLLLHRTISPIWMVFVPVIFFSQAIRYWAIASLGIRWNTKIILMPEEQVVITGPYQYFRHPNYVAVTAEILFFPLLFEAYGTAILFTILNVMMLSVRIPAEERALKAHTNYQSAFRLMDQSETE